MGGGTTIYTSTSLATQQLHNFTFNNDIMSAVWVKSSAGGTTCPPAIYGCIYHPPRADEETTLNYLVKTLTEILVKYPNHSLVLGGDFNSLDCSALENVFHLTNIVKFPTRENSFLDKIYTNDMSYINANVQKCAPLGKADHACVLVHDVILKKSEYRTVYKRTVTTDARYSIMLDIAKIDWSYLCNITDLDVKVESFQKIVQDIYQKHCPLKRYRVKQDSSPTWETPLIQKLRRAKDKAYSKGKPTYAYLRKTLELFIAKAKKRYYDQKLNNLKAGSGNWWKSVKSLDNNANTKTQKYYNIDGKLSSPQQLVNQLNDYYVNISDASAGNRMTPHTSAWLPTTNEVSIGQVKLVLKNLNSQKANHSDDYPSWITKLCYEDLCGPITDIINQVLREAKYPNLYKSAEVTPIAKNNSPSACSDYRPISLLWHVGKVAELFINRRLRAALLPKLHKNQFAYMQGVGCSDALVSVLDDITDIVDKSSNIGAQIILYDFSKAFDLMDHSLLLKKLDDFSLPPYLVALSANYLLNRRQCVSLRQHNVKSPYMSCKTGVPQGTLCGPTLWLAFVNSLQFTTGTTMKYADDTSTYIPITKTNISVINSTKSHVEFHPPDVSQQLINQCSAWATQNSMRLNAAKTKVMNLSLRKTLTMSSNLLMNEQHKVENVSSSKLLGVTIDEHLTFQTHVEEIKKAANRKSHGLLLLKQSGVNQESLVHLYKTRVIPTISHAAPSWYPFITQLQQKEIESCQKLALQIIYPEVDDYHERLAAAMLPTLNETLKTMCHAFVRRVKENRDHPLNARLPTRKDGIRYSNRTSDKSIYLPRCRTEKRRSAILVNKEFLC